MPDCKSSGTEKHLCHFPLPRGKFFLTNSSPSMWPYEGSGFVQCLSVISLPCKNPKPYLLALPAANANSFKLKTDAQASVALLATLVFAHSVFVLGFTSISPELSFRVGKREESKRRRMRKEDK